MLRLKRLPQVVDKNLPIIKITTICCEIKETKSQKNATQMKENTNFYDGTCNDKRCVCRRLADAERVPR